jgi:beta-glucosidase/6-phospho-beta-glucosidase/beta-galactosidase
MKPPFRGVQEQEQHVEFFLDSIKSEQTRIKYSSYFRKYLEITGISNPLAEKDSRVIERQIIDFIIKMKKKARVTGRFTTMLV